MNHECQNCEWTGPEEELVNADNIPDIHQRVDPGEPMPSGECPKCGCLCHEVEDEDYESPMEHWSSPNGCHEDCPACEDERAHRGEDGSPNESRLEDWQYQVANGDTRLGFTEWCANNPLVKS